MINFSKLTANQKFIVNTTAISGITMFSILATQEFSLSVLYSGIVAGVLTALIQLKKISESTYDNTILMVI